MKLIFFNMCINIARYLFYILRTIVKNFRQLSLSGILGATGSLCSIIGIILYLYPIDHNEAHINDIKLESNSVAPTEYFPMNIGSYWNYIVSVLEHSENGHDLEIKNYVLKKQIVYKEDAPDTNVQIIGLAIEGSEPSVLCFSISNDLFKLKGDIAEWYIRDMAAIYERKSRTDAYELSAMLHKLVLDGRNATVSRRDEKNIPWYNDGIICEIPLIVGNCWIQDDFKFCVEAQEDKKVMAGEFKNCYRIACRTLPDSTVYWVHPRIGIILKEYHHYGSINDVRMELSDYKIERPRTGPIVKISELKEGR